MTEQDSLRKAKLDQLQKDIQDGIENVLALTGDYPSAGDHPEAKPVFDLDSVELLDVIKVMQEGKDMKGKSLEPRVFRLT